MVMATEEVIIREDLAGAVAQLMVNLELCSVKKILTKLLKQLLHLLNHSAGDSAGRSEASQAVQLTLKLDRQVSALEDDEMNSSH